MNNLPEALDESLRRSRLLPPAERLLLAVSGGLDSMVLLDLLSVLQPRHGWQIEVAHYNHRLRGQAAEADARLVQKHCVELGCRCWVGGGNVSQAASRAGLSIEMAAREMRHQFLANVCRRRGIRSLVLAHHADDQVELFLLRLLRGAGPAGLSGMASSDPSPVDPRIRIVRPLLDWTKADLAAYARSHRVRYREDATNRDSDPLRNRVRNLLIPYLRRRFQPALGRVLLRDMELLRAQEQYLERQADDWLSRPGETQWEALPLALQRSCLLRQLQHLKVEPSFDLIESLRTAADEPRTISPRRCVRRTADGRVVIDKPRRTRFSRQQRSLRLDRGSGRLTFAESHLEWQVIPKPSAASVQDLRLEPGEVFDADRVGRSIRLRHWRPGDRFHRIGMPKPSKLQDLFVNQKIPRDARRRLAVAEASDGSIFWVEGLRIAEPFKVVDTTQRVLRWRWTSGPLEPATRGANRRQASKGLS